MEPFLYLAPIRGLTDCIYRELFTSHFGGFNASIAPFINPQKNSSFKTKLLRDVLPENNKLLPLVPQLLHTSVDDFLALAARLEDLGYNHINWNLGCPAPMVVHKKRGSGFLPYPDEISAFLDKVMPKLNCSLSIKTRLGFTVNDELEQLLPRLDDFPLKELIIHARLGKQMYKGNTDIDAFEKSLQLTKHHIIYNGDITELNAFNELRCRMPQVTSFMIGRGAIADPFLPSQIKGATINKEASKDLIKKFHDDLYQQYSERLSGPSHILGRMKQIWQYLIFSFPGKQKELKKLNKVHSLEKYCACVNTIFDA